MNHSLSDTSLNRFDVFPKSPEKDGKEEGRLRKSAPLYLRASFGAHKESCGLRKIKAFKQALF